MTPTELRVLTLKNLDAAMSEYMDGAVSETQFADMCLEIINEFLAQFGDL